jgi:2-polyprenyl-3-methyl-5-hydroxy-6-metoxy-1,4-benzoquinol methylase
MRITIEDVRISEEEKSEIKDLLSRPQENRSDLEQMWFLMDYVWDMNNCNNTNLNAEAIQKFYSHSVWLLNGLFIEQHELSLKHRQAISDWIVSHDFKKIVDFGGGFGTLARMVAEKKNDITIYLYEPHSSRFGIKRTEDFHNIIIIENLGDGYDCLVSTDVLEHVSNPLELLWMMIRSVKTEGYLVIANNFYPIIKCHLPATFHLRYTFAIFAYIMGMKKIGKIKGSHATIYKKIRCKEANWKLISKLEIISNRIFPIFNMMDMIAKMFLGGV